jgi:hypothetical protein
VPTTAMILLAQVLALAPRLSGMELAALAA